jgi:hypothetical protein
MDWRSGTSDSRPEPFNERLKTKVTRSKSIIEVFDSHNQEEILFLPRTTQGRDPIKEADLRPIAKTLDWNKQRQMWRELKKNSPAVNPAVG